MAEVAAGAVSSLLGVIRNEAVLLRRVRGDVQFIKEEMESMKSFLAHLARSAPAGGEHEEQVRTWMNQVRLLAQDCNNCIDLYLYRGNPDIHRARGGLRRYLWWVPWLLHKLAAQHRAAVQLGELRERARDVGERRLRYGVEVPAKSAAGQSPPATKLKAAATPSSSTQAAAAHRYADGEDEEDSDDDQLAVATMADHSGQRSFFEPRTLDDYVKAKILEWYNYFPPGANETMSLAIVAPDKDPDALDIALELLIFRPGRSRGYHCAVKIDIPAVHHELLPLRPKEVLFYILRELKLKHPKFQSREQGTGQGKGEEDPDSWQDYKRKFDIYYEKKRVLGKIKANIEETKVYKKLDKIKSDIQGPPLKRLEKKKGMDQLDLTVVLQLLLHSPAASEQDQVKNKDIHKLLEWDDNVIAKIAEKLKKHMEEDEKDKKLEEKMGVEGGRGGREGEAKGGGREAKEEEEEEKEEEGDDEEEEDKEEERGGREGEAKGGGGKAEEEEEEEEEEEDKEEEREAKEEDEEEDDDEEEEEEEEEEDSEEEEAIQQMGPIRLHQAQYAHILRKLFPKISSNKSMQTQQQHRSSARQATKTTLGEDQIKQMIHDAKQEILCELQEDKNDKNQATGEPGGTPGQNQEVVLEEIDDKMDEIKQEFKEQLKIKGLVDRIKHHLKGKCPLFILKVDEMMDVSRWEDTRNALSLLQLSADVLIVTNTKSIQQAKEYCYPRRDPIDYSLAGLYYDRVLKLTIQQKNEDNYNPQIFRDILEECEPNEFCMKIFTHALYVNPKRSTEELIKLLNDLQEWPKSFDSIAKKMFKFSYSDLPKEYKSCLLYLAIFPPEHKIRRSSLIGRWVAEGLIFKEDWPSSVRRANRCFDALIDRWLVYPADIGATEKANSCVVGDQVHGFITKIARKQHIVETRLSRHLARHFSIFNDIQLLSSDRIDKFFQRLSKSSRVSLLKVLDLEGCQRFGGKNQRYLRDICSKMLLLKYLSLRGTDITQLPSEINNLRELEVLDIRQTKVPAYATTNVLLLKLKRLLAGHINSSPSNSNTGTTIRAEKLESSVQIPHKIEKMVNMEVLYNVKAQSSKDLIDIGKLWHLRKLGVVIDDKTSHLKHLLRTISNLHECLCSLSITLPLARSECTPSSEELAASLHPIHPPKLLESLSISGTTQKGQLLPLFVKAGNNNLVKLTLSSTSLNQDNLKVLAKLPKLRCVRLRHIAYTESMLTINEGEFKYLKELVVEGSNLTEIIFKEGAASELEKMVLSFTTIGSVSGANDLQKLEELELNDDNNNDIGRLLSSFEQIAKLTLRGTLLKQGDLQNITKKPNMRCLVLLDKSCEVSQITFSKDELPKLNHFIVRCSAITDIAFNSGSAPKLEKIVWSSRSLSGINNLPRLKELEFNGDLVPNEMNEEIKKHSNRPVLKHNKPEIQDPENVDEQEDDDDAAGFPFCWKNQV